MYELSCQLVGAVAEAGLGLCKLNFPLNIDWKIKCQCGLTDGICHAYCGFILSYLQYLNNLCTDILDIFLLIISEGKLQCKQP